MRATPVVVTDAEDSRSEKESRSPRVLSRTRDRCALYRSTTVDRAESLLGTVNSRTRITLTFNPRFRNRDFALHRGVVAEYLFAREAVIDQFVDCIGDGGVAGIGCRDGLEHRNLLLVGFSFELQIAKRLRTMVGVMRGSVCAVAHTKSERLLNPGAATDPRLILMGASIATRVAALGSRSTIQ
jgi:hypothetical protein